MTDRPSELRRIDADLADIRTTLKLHGWMLTLSIGLSVAILARLLFIPPFH